MYFSINKFAGALITYCTIVAIVKGIDLQQAIFLICYIGIYIALVNYEGRRDIVYDFCILVACLNLVFQIFQFFHMHWISVESGQLVGLMSNQNETSALYAITAAACLRKNRYYFLAVIVAGLAFSSSVGGVLAFVGMMLIWTILKVDRWKNRIAIIASLVLFFVLFNTFIHSVDLAKRQKERFFVWGKTITVAMLQNIGWGWGQFDKVIPLITSWKHITDAQRMQVIALVRDKPALFKAIQITTANEPDLLESDKMLTHVFVQAHNEFVEFLFTCGWVGMIFLFAFIGSALWTAFKNPDIVPFYGILAACGSCMTFFSMHIVTTAIITLVYFSWVSGNVGTERR
jgi:hypothetical protein